MNLSVMSRTELMLISAEAEDALKMLMYRIRRDQEARLVTTTESPQAASTTSDSATP